MDYIPEITAQTVFIPSGLFMGYLFYIFEFFEPEDLGQIQYWPWLLGIISAAVTAICMTVIKINMKKDNFYYLYVIIFGTLLFFISGCLFLIELGTTAIYVSAISHGMTYVSLFSYLNLRIQPNKRAFRLIACHVLYFLGCALSSQAINVANIQLITPTQNFFYEPIGVLMTVTSGISLFLLLINESLHHFRISDYKRSLDEYINRDNDKGRLYLTRNELIASIKDNPIPGFQLNVTEGFNQKSSLWILLLKLKGFMIFSPIMIFYAGLATMLENENKFFNSIQWMILGGAFVGLIPLIFYNTKNLFYLFSVCETLGLVATILVYSDPESLEDTAIAFWMYYAFLGAGYGITNLSLLDATTLRYTELVLATGYIIEILPVAILQYFFFFKREHEGLESDLATFRIHGVTFICLILISIAIVWYYLPNSKGKSRMQMQYEMCGIYFRRVNERRTRKITPPSEYIQQRLYTINECPSCSCSQVDLGVPSRITLDGVANGSIFV